MVALNRNGSCSTGTTCARTSASRSTPRSRPPSMIRPASGNRPGWIVDAMKRPFHRLGNGGLEVRIVHCRGVSDRLRDLVGN